MQTPTQQLGTGVLIRLGRWHEVTLSQFEETQPMVEEVHLSVRRLKDASKKTDDVEDRLLLPRVTIAITEVKINRDFRKLAGAAQMLDGGKGESSKGLFPHGITPLIQKTGDRKVEEIDAVNERAKSRGLDTKEPIAQILESLLASRVILVTNLELRKSILGEVSGAQLEEQIAREDFCTLYSKNAGLIRSIYPKDRDMQELFFDAIRKSSKRSKSKSETPVTSDGETTAT